MKRKFAIADIRLPDTCKSALLAKGFEVLLLPPSSKLDTSIESHTDMLIFFGEDRIITEREYYLANKVLIDNIAALGRRRVVTSSLGFQKDYPYDAILNALKTSHSLVLKSDTAAPELAEYAKDFGMKLVISKQGYPACTALYLGKEIAVTSDRGMARLLENQGISTTIINNTDKILLPPHDYGFIGGCAGVYEDKLYFIGNLDSHPESSIIRKSAESAGLTCVSLDEEADSLFDLGGLRFFDEAVDSDGK